MPSTVKASGGDKYNNVTMSQNDRDDEIFTGESSSKVKLVTTNDQIRRLQTIIRDKNVSRSEFVFSADRLIRLVIEEGLNLLPFSEHIVTTPSGHEYDGIKFNKGNCGVSIIRSGEAMEQALRESCRSIRIGKILIQSDEETDKAKVYYAKLPKDISKRTVLLMYPILSSGNTVLKAIEVLREHGVIDEKIILLTLFVTPEGIDTLSSAHSKITVLSTEMNPVVPVHFGKKYFGTD
ncbi:uracil phosphoribosyltransferase homolog [Clavelina lepadiformis]|uniref:Phosphoribosyltransferase domain-containing protein n=1 Tax=Clavelina lepadiformis TaxID=159417 RepID=A0ABP0G2H4_CLALP